MGQQLAAFKEQQQLQKKAAPMSPALHKSPLPPKKQAQPLNSPKKQNAIPKNAQKNDVPKAEGAEVSSPKEKKGGF